MFNIFRKEDTQQNLMLNSDSDYGSTGGYAPNTLISYKLNLIDTLKSEHQDIHKLLDDINLQYRKNSIKKVKSLLLDFRYDYKTHVLKEHVLLYAYLRNSTKKHKKLHSDICTSERYMRKLSNKIIKFCDVWLEAKQSDFKVSFPKDFKRIYDAVTLRNAFEEEKLFKAYREPSAYVVV